MKENLYWQIKESNPESLALGRLPYRKSVSLSLLKGNTILPLAYFRDDDAVDAFVDFCLANGWMKQEPAND